MKNLRGTGRAKIGRRGWRRMNSTWRESALWPRSRILKVITTSAVVLSFDPILTINNLRTINYD
jgi:hypothetical protein